MCQEKYTRRYKEKLPGQHPRSFYAHDNHIPITAFCHKDGFLRFVAALRNRIGIFQITNWDNFGRKLSSFRGFIVQQKGRTGNM